MKNNEIQVQESSEVKGLFYITLTLIPRLLTFKEIVETINFDHKFPMFKEGEFSSFFDKYIPKINEDGAEFYFYKQSQKFNRKEVVDFYKKRNLIGDPIAHLKAFADHRDFFSNLTLTSFFPSGDGGYMQVTTHNSETSTIEGTNFDFHNCAQSWSSKEGDYLCGIKSVFNQDLYKKYI